VQFLEVHQDHRSRKF